MTTEAGPWGSAYRAIRTARPREDAPWPGVLARAADGTRLMVDAAVLGPEWTGWSQPADGHVLAPLDIARRLDGHDVVLPVCTERLEDFARRRQARMPLTTGEAVTLGVSVLRGCCQLVATPPVRGEWWLDDAGRPVVATDAASHGAFEAAGALLSTIAVDAVLADAWLLAQRAICADRVSVQDLVLAEEALFELAAPEPLSTISLRPRSAVELSSARSLPASAATSEEISPRTAWQSLLSSVDDGLADSVSRATTAVWRRLRAGERPPGASRRRTPWLVAAVVAVAVLAGGFLWPTADDSPADEASAVSRTATDPPATAGSGTDARDVTGDPAPAPSAAADEPVGVVDEPVGVVDDLATATAALLDARLACDGAAACLASVLADPASPLPGGAIDLPADARTVTLLDDFGDLAVLRVDAIGEASVAQLAVIVRTDEKWLLRDVHDVAQQP